MQCSGTTKAGVRCKRKVRNGAYCPLHEDQEASSSSSSRASSTVSRGKTTRKVIQKFHPNEDQSWSTLAQELYEFGVTVITDTWLTDRIEEFQERWEEMVAEFPEYRDTTRLVKGGFMALGNPSSFHHPLPRLTREWAMSCIVPLMAEYRTRLDDDKEFLEQLIDRMMDRNPGVKVSAESWHRDEAIFAPKKGGDGILPGDLTFGGWQNFERDNEYFSCVIGTHLIGQRGKDTGKGFNRLTKDEVREFSDDPRRRHIEIPPGAIIIFNENIVHEVVPIVKKHHVRRIFLGWRLTNGEEPMFKDNMDRFDRQAPFRIKSGQEAAMWPSCSWIYTRQREDLATWSEQTFVDEVLEDKIFKQGTPEEQVFRVVPRYMAGLEDYGLPKFTEYTDDELRLYIPGNVWEVLAPGQDEEVVELQL